MCGQTEDGGGEKVIRARKERLEFGEVRPLKEGQAIHGEVVRLKAREGSPALFDVESTVVAAKSSGTDDIETTSNTGPRQVSNPNYRKGWSRTFAGSSRLN